MQTTILGINIGTRTLGLAVIQGDLLCDWRVKTLYGKWSKQKLKSSLQFIEKHISNYGIGYIALKVPHNSRISKGLRQLLVGIRILSDKQSLPYFEYSIEDLERFCSSEYRLNKTVLGEYVAKTFPHLLYEYNRQANIKNSYYDKVFAAIVAAKLCSESKQCTMKKKKNTS
jgi:hypothetical protein